MLIFYFNIYTPCVIAKTGGFAVQWRLVHANFACDWRLYMQGPSAVLVTCKLNPGSRHVHAQLVKFACVWRPPWFKLHATDDQTANSYAKFACAVGHINAKPPIISNDAGRTNIWIKKWRHKIKKMKIQRGNSTFRGLSTNTKHGPLQTHETVPLSTLSMGPPQILIVNTSKRDLSIDTPFNLPAFSWNNLNLVYVPGNSRKPQNTLKIIN